MNTIYYDIFKVNIKNQSILISVARACFKVLFILSYKPRRI